MHALLLNFFYYIIKNKNNIKYELLLKENTKFYNNIT